MIHSNKVIFLLQKRGVNMCFSDDEKYYNEWENSDFQGDISFEDYAHNRRVSDYGLTDEEMDSGDND